MCVMPYTGKSSPDLRAHLRRTIEKNAPFCWLNVVFRSTCSFGDLFRFKDSLEKKKSSLEQPTTIHVVTARLLIRENFVTFLLLWCLSTSEL